MPALACQVHFLWSYDSSPQHPIQKDVLSHRSQDSLSRRQPGRAESEASPSSVEIQRCACDQTRSCERGRGRLRRREGEVRAVTTCENGCCSTTPRRRVLTD